MTAQFRLTEPAIQDIEQIADYIARQSGLNQADSEALLRSADRFLNKLDAKFVKIAHFPNLGQQRDEILSGLRSFPMDNYLILYMVNGQDVEIFRVVSGYRDLSALFTDADD
jgi:toxin ParE1/3/4